MADIITLGELLIDLTQTGIDANGYPEFKAYPGGAPANVAVAASRLGASSAFIGKVGDDAFGRGLSETLDREGVDISGLYYSVDIPTTMAIVSVDEAGEREFSFYRNPGADTALTPHEALSAVHSLRSASNCCGILHVGSLSLTDSPSREATYTSAEFARTCGMIVSYDPNYRAALWGSEEDAVEMMKSMLDSVDILKVAEEELEMLSGCSDPEEGSEILSEHGIELVMVTLGERGVYVRFKGRGEYVPGYKVNVADTNGAGDTFTGAMLTQIAEHLTSSGQALSDIDYNSLISMVRVANKAASVTCSGHGAIPAMPREEDL